MARIVKFKIVLSLFSVSILVFIHLFENNFYTTGTIKRWQTLTWDDFQGFGKPFSRWDAAIHSDVYLEFDSATFTYTAYAGQHSRFSWKKQSSTGSAYLLNHEQYHFNLTEIYARKMNFFIRENPGKDITLYWKELERLRDELGWMQSRYDRDSKHSINVDRQRHWEYRIDSLLMVYSLDSGFVTDLYSGAKVYFPIKPNFDHGISSNKSAAYREFYLRKYGMTLSMVSYQGQFFDANDFIENISVIYHKDSFDLQSIEIDSVDVLNIHAKSIDSIENRVQHDFWIHQGEYLYRLMTSYDQTNQVDGFEAITRSFFDSFEIVNTDYFWINRLTEGSLPLVWYTPVESKNPSDGLCLIRGAEELLGFYRGPFFADDGRMIISLDVLSHADSLRDQNFLAVDANLFSFRPDSVFNIYYLPAENVPRGAFEVDFGYVLKEKGHKCTRFHHHSVEVKPFHHLTH